MNISSLQGSGRTHVVVIMSDNGAEGQRLKVILVLAGATVNDVYEKYYDNLIVQKRNCDREVVPVRGKSWRALIEASSDTQVTL